MASVFEWLWAVVRISYCVLQTLSFTVVYITYVTLLIPIYYLWPRFYWYLEGKIYRWMQAQVGYWGITGGFKLEEYGDEMEVWDQRCLVMANHQSTADVPCISALLQDKGKAANKVCWVIDSGFKWTPFGICGRVHGDCFVTQGKASREREMENLRKNLQRVFWNRDRRWIVIFPEGNFHYKQKDSNKRWAEKNGHPLTDHVLLPRYGAVKLALDHIGPTKDRSRAASNTEMWDSGDAPANLEVPGTEGMKRVSSRTELIKDTLSAIRSKNYLNDGEEGRPYRMPYHKLIAQTAFFLLSGICIARYVAWPPIALLMSLF